VKNWRKTIGTEEKSDVRQLAKGEPFVDICHNVRLPHSSIRTICDNADNKERAKCLDNIKHQQSEIDGVCLCSKTTAVCVARQQHSCQNVLCQKLWIGAY
jgi:hypothetical protein